MTGRGAACLEILDPGLLATVQDAGRPGLGALGVGPGGAADPVALVVANALLGNPGDAAVLEITLSGAAIRVMRDVVVGLAGADLGARVAGGAGSVPPGRTIRLRAGDTLSFEGSATPAVRGCRAYLALPGGVDVPRVLGSRATALGAGFGGLDGRALRAGDILAASDASLDRPAAAWAGPVSDPAAGPFRMLPGPHATDPRAAPAPGTAPAVDANRCAGLAAGAWTVRPASDRTGLRLDGVPLTGGTADLASHGVLAGTVQLPPDGSPIVLLADHQPTGGYPVVAVVVRADRARLGQLAPGDPVAFEVVDQAAARRLAAALDAALAAGLAGLREAGTWDELWRGAGG